MHQLMVAMCSQLIVGVVVVADRQTARDGHGHHGHQPADQQDPTLPGDQQGPTFPGDQQDPTLPGDQQGPTLPGDLYLIRNIL